MPYTEGCALNPILKGTNINLICNNATEEYNLEVTNMSRVDEGSYTCLHTDIWNYRIFNIFVKISPNVDVSYNLTNGTLNFACSPSGIPNNYTFLQLEHRSEFSEHIRFMNFSNDGSVLRISIENPGIQDAGIYVCNVSNDVPDQNRRQFQFGKTLVELEGISIELLKRCTRIPRWGYYQHVKFNEVIGISAVVYSRHNVTEAVLHRNAESQQRNLESVFATAAVLTLLGIGLTVALLIWKRGQSVAKEVYTSTEFVNSDNPQHLLKATESGGYMYHATAPTSLNEPTRYNQGNKNLKQRFS
ncbi:HMCN [Mytilus edulis]|uniref:HMCN n=1 Tax=Mytilus edulis TaxID=6550 RepID=A0A8S3RQ05_MYTED|nr:HMCN [Mytilus edulis]